jgi:hypothetical protein
VRERQACRPGLPSPARRRAWEARRRVIEGITRLVSR